MFTEAAAESCLQAKNIYTSTTDMIFEYVPLKTSRCDLVKNVTMELRFIVEVNGINEYYGIFRKAISWDLTVNESSITFTCADDIGDSTIDIKGTCDSRFVLYKKQIVAQKLARFIIAVPSKFDYAVTVFNQDYTNGYAVIAGYCSFLVVAGLIIILIISKRMKDNTNE